MLVIIKTKNAFTKPKYKPRSIHNQWGVFNADTGITELRDVCHLTAIKYIEESKNV